MAQLAVDVGTGSASDREVYRNWIDHLISLETNASDGHSVYENAQGVNATGAELEFGAHLKDGIEARANWSYTAVQQDGTSQTMPNSPRQLGKLDASVPILRQKLFASLNAQYTSPVKTLDGNTVSGFSALNVTLLGHTFGKHLDVSASGYNILNKRYFNPGRPEDPEDATQQDGATFRAKATYKF